MFRSNSRDIKRPVEESVLENRRPDTNTTLLSNIPSHSDIEARNIMISQYFLIKPNAL